MIRGFGLEDEARDGDDDDEEEEGFLRERRDGELEEATLKLLGMDEAEATNRFLGFGVWICEVRNSIWFFFYFLWI